MGDVMANVILILLLILLCADVSVTLMIWLRLTERERSERYDRKVDEALEEDTRRSKAMDDGFDNLMRYSVMGRDGFGGET